MAARDYAISLAGRGAVRPNGGPLAHDKGGRMKDEPPRTGKRIKKSDTLQVRIPHETKQAFTEACREDDVAVSDRIRGWIENFLATRQRPSEIPSKGIIAMIPRRVRKRRYLAGGVAVLGVTALLALPSAANTTFRAMFDQLDVNRDGKVTEQEFMAMVKKRPYIDIGLLKWDPELREKVIAGLKRDDLGRPLRKEELPPSDPELRAAVARGERPLESLSDQELSDILPVWDDKNFPVASHNIREPKDKALPPKLPLATLEQQLEMEKKMREQAEKDFANPNPRPRGAKMEDMCGGPGISDAEFANPWMNSSATDMLKMFKDGDRNRDGVVTFEEFQISQTETARIWFGSMDMDSDNKLTMQDFMAGQEKWKKFVDEHPDMLTCTPANPRPRWFPLDTNNDGAVSFEEYLVPAQVLDPR
jgi:Ca2+-binding EF-hand superfamily protein